MPRGERIGCVAILDSLGTKGVWSHRRLDRLVTDWELILEHFRTNVLPRRLMEADGVPPLRIEVSGFSDTVIVTGSVADTKPRMTLGGKRFGPFIWDYRKNAQEWKIDPNVVAAFADYLMYPFIGAFLRGFPFRGVVSAGEFYRSKNLVIGPAIDEAVGWYERPEWIGVSLTPSALYALEKHSEFPRAVRRVLVPYNVPIKPDKQTKAVHHATWALAWPFEADSVLEGSIRVEGRPRESRIEHRDIDFRTRMIEVFQRGPVDDRVATKQRNTLEFFDKFRPRKIPSFLGHVMSSRSRPKRGSTPLSPGWRRY